MTMLAFAPILQQQIAPAAGGPAATSLALSTEPTTPAYVNFPTTADSFESDVVLASTSDDLIVTCDVLVGPRGVFEYWITATANEFYVGLTNADQLYMRFTNAVGSTIENSTAITVVEGDRLVAEFTHSPTAGTLDYRYKVNDSTWITDQAQDATTVAALLQSNPLAVGQGTGTGIPNVISATVVQGGVTVLDFHEYQADLGGWTDALGTTWTVNGTPVLDPGTEDEKNITAENGDYLLIEGDGLLAENGTDLVTTEDDRFLVLDADYGIEVAPTASTSAVNTDSTITYPTSTASGDLILIAQCDRTGDGTFTFVPDVGSFTSLIDSEVETGGAFATRLRVLYKVVTSDTEVVYTRTGGVGTGTHICQVTRITATSAWPATPAALINDGGTSGTSTTTVTTSGSTLNNGGMALVALAVSDGFSSGELVSVDAGWTAGPSQATNNSNDGNIALIYKEMLIAGDTGDMNGTLGASGDVFHKWALIELGDN